MILDDYSMGLDAGYRRLFLDYLKEYTKSEEKTIFITSHIIQDLEDLIDDCVILDYRSVLLSTTVNEFRDNFRQFKFEIDETGADLLLAGGRSLYTAIKKGIAFADVNQEKKKSYGGYDGLLNLAEDLKNALQNPVFKNVARRAPWEK
jgi:ABC-type multidrug transport system ATPase subunit